MAASITFVFDASPLIASCQFAMGQRSVADIALSGATVQIPLTKPTLAWVHRRGARRSGVIRPFAAAKSR
jgi:hypothetical protein